MIILSIFLLSSSQTIILLSMFYFFVCFFAMLVVELRDSSMLDKHCISKLSSKNFSKLVWITMLLLW